MRKKRDAQSIIFMNILLMNICICFVVMFTVAGYLIYTSFETLKASRLEVLEQEVEKNQIYNRIILYYTDDIYDIFYDRLSDFDNSSQAELGKDIEQAVNKKGEILRELEIYPQISILMKDGYMFSPGAISESETKKIANSYWYISNMTNTKESLWTSAYDFSQSGLSMDILHGRSILDSEKNYKGIILVSIKADFLKAPVDEKISEGTVRYIIDENGTAISHSIPALLGCSLYYMPYFREQFEPNSSTWLKKNTTISLCTNYYDSVTGWTIVEEKDIKSILTEYREIIMVFCLLLFFSFILSILVSFLLARKISKPIVSMAKQMISYSDTGVGKIDVNSNYKEIYALGNIYNMTVEKMNQLIETNKEKERQKRKAEIDFLQAQINPHFLHNTLFSIKCLIEMKKYEKAHDMMQNLMKVLKMPINVSKEWIKIEEEIKYLESYLYLMQMRYENRKISMQVSIEDSCKDISIPRLLLQPIIENSIFHGFDEGQDTAIINIEIHRSGERLIIRIRDNGKGMSHEELKELWQSSYKNSQVFNRIGLGNIRQRINLLYGEDCGIVILSRQGEGTETILTLKPLKENT